MSGKRVRTPEEEQQQQQQQSGMCPLLRLPLDPSVAVTQYLVLCDLGRLACCHSALRALCTLRVADGVSSASPAVVRRKTFMGPSFVASFRVPDLLWDQLIGQMRVLETVVVSDESCPGPLRRLLLTRDTKEPARNSLRAVRSNLRALCDTLAALFTTHPLLETFETSARITLAIPTLPAMAELRVFSSPAWQMLAVDLRRIAGACPRLERLDVFYTQPDKSLSAKTLGVFSSTLTDLCIRAWRAEPCALEWDSLAPLAKTLVRLRLDGADRAWRLLLLGWNDNGEASGAGRLLKAATEPLVFESLQSLELDRTLTFSAADCGPLRFPRLTHLTTGRILFACPPDEPSAVMTTMAPAVEQLHLTALMILGEATISPFERRPAVAWPRLRRLRLSRSSDATEARRRLQIARPSLVLACDDKSLHG